jgi:penicillin-binding protein 1B
MTTDPFIVQLAGLCRSEPIRAKWVLVASHAAGLALGDRLARDGRHWVNLRFATPLDVARAYTVFANDGMRVDPALVAMVRDRDGRVLYRHTAEPRRALDPRVVYLMVNLLEGVLRNGTGAGVRRLGFTAPAAGKTGTSRDGWFAGFTSGLLCIVWVGFDDGRDLNLEGAHSALPIWT